MRSILLILMLFYNISYSNNYWITYTTTEDQQTIKQALIKTTIDGNIIKVDIIENNKIIFSFNASNQLGFLKVIPNETIEGGYLYKHLGKLRGNLFIKNSDNLILIIREK